MPAKRSKPEEDTPTSLVVETADDFEVPTVVANVVTYIGGYIVREVKIGQKCSKCLSKLTKCGSTVEEADLLCHYKAYKQISESASGSLIVPSASLTKFLKRVEKLFVSYIPETFSCQNLLATLLEEAKQRIPARAIILCSQHKNSDMSFAIVKCYLKCRLHYYFKFESRSLLQQKYKANQKAKILLCEHIESNKLVSQKYH